MGNKTLIAAVVLAVVAGLCTVVAAQRGVGRAGELEAVHAVDAVAE